MLTALYHEAAAWEYFTQKIPCGEDWANSVLLVFLKECPEPEEVCGAPFTGGAKHPLIPTESLGYSASRKGGSSEILESLPMPKQAPREQERVFG